MPADHPEYLFVYGTLRRDFRHPLQALMEKYARHAGTAHYAGRLFDLGEYPGVVPAPGARARVVGDLYLVTSAQHLFPVLDRYEGCTDEGDHPAEYRREQQMVRLADERDCPAWIYLWNAAPPEGQIIPSGDYLQYLQGERNVCAGNAQ